MERTRRSRNELESNGQDDGDNGEESPGDGSRKHLSTCDTRSYRPFKNVRAYDQTSYRVSIGWKPDRHFALSCCRLFLVFYPDKPLPNFSTCSFHDVPSLRDGQTIDVSEVHDWRLI